MTDEQWGFWTPESWRQYRNYADQVWLEFRFVEHPTAPSEEDWLVLAQGAAWDQDWLVSRIEELGHAPPQQVEGEPPRPLGEPLYHMRIQDTKSSWGADGAALQVLVDVSIGVLGSAAFEGMKRLTREMADRLRGETQISPQGALTEDEAVERVRWMVSRRYSVPEIGLSLRSVELRSHDGAATVQLTDESGTTYSCNLVTLDGLVSFAKVRREPSLLHESSDPETNGN